MANIHGGTSGVAAEVETVSKGIRNELFDAAGNSLAKTKGAAVLSTDGALPIAGVNDGVYRPVRMDRTGAIATTRATPAFYAHQEGTAVNAAWVNTNTTMSSAQTTTAGINLNSAGGVALNTRSSITSRKVIKRFMRAPLHLRMRARLIKGGTNGQAEWGFQDATTSNVTAATYGFFFNYTAAGALVPQCVFNSIAISGTDFSASIDSSRYYNWDIIVDDNSANFVVQDATTGLIITDQTINISADAGRFIQLSGSPIGARVYIQGTAASAPATQLFVGEVYCAYLDADFQKPWPHVAASMLNNTLYNPTLYTQAQTFANSAFPASFTLSNTAAGAATLGGLFQFAAVGGGVTDYNLFGYPVPTPYDLIITGIDIEVWNTGAAVATSPHLFVWGVGVNGASANLSTGGFLRYALGAQQMATGSAIGFKAERISKSFQTPIVCSAGLNLSIILRMPVATATASQVLQGMVSIEGYFE